MLLDTDNTAVPPRRGNARQIEYLLVAALAAITTILFFAMGFFSHAAAAGVTDWGGAAETAGAAGPVVQAVNPADLLQTATLADRHILIGLTLIAIAVMAATTFSLWRWQLRGLVYEAHHRAQ